MNEEIIEQELIEKLSALKYDRRSDITDRASLEANFRKKFEELNQVHLTDNEFDRLLTHIVAPDVYKAARTLRARHSFERDDGTPLHYTLVNTTDWCKNSFEVINQLRMNTDYSHHRYDVILLINGVPVVQIELKKSLVSPRKAMQQIVEYKNDPGNGYSRTLMCFIQLFIVSNKTDTWYFANNKKEHFSFNAEERFLSIYRFADKSNKKIVDLESFAEQFLPKCTLGHMISRYMVLVESEQKLLVMRPYQIYAVKAIVDCIRQGTGNGYVWHTTGSGKTLTSFKASTLLKDNPDIKKCLFVVDRKDLDRQTREEFNRFQEGCVEENTNTHTLVERLVSNNYRDKVIVTTIQKLGLALDGKNKRDYKKRLEPLRDERIVFIFDECHRSQFGDNHQAIKEFFPNAQLFGFTGTPIFEQNAIYQQVREQQASLITTEDIFPHCLHAYTITHAIEDDNVLRFRVHYYKPEGKDKPKRTEPLAKKAIIESIIKNHGAVTHNRRYNALLATSRINDAIEYYNLFKKMQENRQAEDEDFQPLNVACVFSPPAEGDKDIKQIQEDLQQEKEDNKEEPDKKKAALKSIIADYNVQYSTNHSIGEFDAYYQDVQKRIKDQQYPNRDLLHSEKIDVMIVVDMLLTGFDSKFLNTLYVDKKLKHHGLIQAFSRTNRVLNFTKPFGNILDFREQQEEVHEAVTLFSGERQEGQARQIWLVEPPQEVIGKLDSAMSQLDDFMQSQGLENKPEQVPNLQGDEARCQFINLFKDVQRIKTQLDQYTDLTEEEEEAVDTMLPVEQLQGFKAMYLETAKRLKDKHEDADTDTTQEVENLDFEFVLFASDIIDYDYIMNLISKYSHVKPSKAEMTREQLIGLIRSDAKFVDEFEDIEEYINTLTIGEGLTEKQIREGYEEFKLAKQNKELKDIAERHGLDFTNLKGFIGNVLGRKIFDDEDLTELYTPMDLGWKERAERKQDLMKELIPLLKKAAQDREISGLAVYEE